MGLAPDASGVKAVEAMEVMAGDPPRPPAGAEGADVLVTSVDEALGRPSGLTVLSGLDDEAWSMRPADLPWCDRASRVSLGLFDGDLPIRRARYALAQLVAFSSSVVVFDTSAEEGAGPSPPLAEWLLHVRRTGRWTALNTARPAGSRPTKAMTSTDCGRSTVMGRSNLDPAVSATAKRGGRAVPEGTLDNAPDWISTPVGTCMLP